MLRHYGLVTSRFGPEKGTMLMRKYAACYAQGRRGARLFRTYVSQVLNEAEFHEVVAKYFPMDDAPAQLSKTPRAESCGEACGD